MRKYIYKTQSSVIFLRLFKFFVVAFVAEGAVAAVGAAVAFAVTGVAAAGAAAGVAQHFAHADDDGRDDYHADDDCLDYVVEGHWGMLV